MLARLQLGPGSIAEGSCAAEPPAPDSNAMPVTGWGRLHGVIRRAVGTVTPSGGHELGKTRLADSHTSTVEAILSATADHASQTCGRL